MIFLQVAIGGARAGGLGLPRAVEGTGQAKMPGKEGEGRGVGLGDDEGGALEVTPDLPDVDVGFAAAVAAAWSINARRRRRRCRRRRRQGSGGGGRDESREPGVASSAHRSPARKPPNRPTSSLSSVWLAGRPPFWFLSTDLSSKCTAQSRRSPEHPYLFMFFLSSFFLWLLLFSPFFFPSSFLSLLSRLVSPSSFLFLLFSEVAAGAKRARLGGKKEGKKKKEKKRRERGKSGQTACAACAACAAGVSGGREQRARAAGVCGVRGRTTKRDSRRAWRARPSSQATKPAKAGQTSPGTQAGNTSWA